MRMHMQWGCSRHWVGRGQSYLVFGLYRLVFKVCRDARFLPASLSFMGIRLLTAQCASLAEKARLRLSLLSCRPACMLVTYSVYGPSSRCHALTLAEADNTKLHVYSRLGNITPQDSQSSETGTNA